MATFNICFKVFAFLSLSLSFLPVCKGQYEDVFPSKGFHFSKECSRSTMKKEIKAFTESLPKLPAQ